jgi:lysophospholipase L1-like esterase
MAPPEAPIDRAVVPYPDILRDMLRPAGWAIDSRAVSGATITDLRAIASMALSVRAPAALVFQCGIVDCTPRPLTTAERALLGRLRPSLLRALVVSLLHRFRSPIIVARRLIQRTPIEAFRAEFAGLVKDVCRVPRVAVLPIFPGSSSVVARNPRLQGEVARYNLVLSSGTGHTAPSVEELLRGHSIDSLAIASDSVHLNQAGHRLVAEWISRWLLAGRDDGARAGS